MCLKTKTNKAKASRKDHTVYKVVHELRNGFMPYYVSPIMRNTYYKIGETYHTLLEDEAHIDFFARKFVSQNDMPKIFYIHKGFHTFNNIKDARRYIGIMEIGSAVIFECTIPKGSKYYQSIDKTECCSDTLIINKII